MSPYKREELPNRIRKIDETWWSLAAAVYVALGVIVLIAASLGSSYSGEPVSERLSFLVADGWCDPSVEGLYGHCFGDFGLKFQEVASGVFYASDSISPANTPVVILIFRWLVWLNYNQALLIWQAAIVGAGLALGLLTALHAKNRSLAVHLFTVVGVLNLGMVSSFDRGNPITVISLLLVVGVLLLEARRNKFVGILLLSLAASLKFWGPLFFLYPIIRGQWKLALQGISIWLTAQSGALLLAPVGPIEALRRHWAWLTDRDYAASLTPFSHSFYAFLSRPSIASDTSVDGAAVNSSFMASLTGALVLGVCIYLAIRVREAPYLPVFPLLLGPVIALPEAMAYNTSLLSAALAIVFIAQSKSIRSSFLESRTIGLKIFLSSILIGSAVLPFVGILGAELFSATSVPIALGIGLGALLIGPLWEVPQN